jgi:uncharacterized protein YegL
LLGKEKKMNDNLTEIVFILDRSGSMCHLVGDTIGGFNSFVEAQKILPGEAKLTTVLFDDKYEVLHKGVDIQNIKPLDDKQYFSRGWTALLDALGKTINDVGHRLAKLPEPDRPGKVIFVITTDGLENASKEFTRVQIKEMIDRQTDVYKWQFIFLGANMDAVNVADSIGIHYSSNYTDDQYGTQTLYSAVTASISGYRGSGTIKEDWNKDIK